jgi:lipoteichoic acid synthase
MLSDYSMRFEGSYCHKTNNLGEETIQLNISKEFFRLCGRHIEFPILFFLLTLKFYSFCKETGLVFVQKYMIIITFGSLLLWFSISLLFQRQLRLWLAWILITLATIIVYADLVYYRYFGDFITTPVLKQSSQAGDIANSITELMKFQDVFYFLDVAILLAVLVWMNFKKIKLPSIPILERVILFIACVIVGGVFVYYPIHLKIEKYGQAFMENMWSNVSVFYTAGHLGFHVYETQRYLKDEFFGKPPLTDQERKAIFTFMDNRSKPSSSFNKMASGKHIMIIQLESFQNFVIGKKINGKEITPHLNALRKEIRYYSHFYHQVGQGRTSDAEFLTNASLYPLPTGSVYVRYPTNSYDSLPAILKENGYETRAYHSFEKTFWNRDQMYQTYGFYQFIGQSNFNRRLPNAPKLGTFSTFGDNEVFQEVVNDLMKATKPTYSFVVALTSHHPYNNMPSETKTLNVAPFEGSLFGNYLTAIHYVDQSIGNMVTMLKEKELWDDTIVLMYGDHDSGIPFSQEHAKALDMPYQQLLSKHTLHNVPFFLHIPGETSGQTIEKSTGMIHITPTILDLLGINGSYLHMGESIGDEKDHLVVFRNGSAIKGDIFYEANPDGVFEHGKCTQVSTEQPISLSSCKDLEKAAKTELKYSDMILYHNLGED